MSTVNGRKRAARVNYAEPDINVDLVMEESPTPESIPTGINIKKDLVESSKKNNPAIPINWQPNQPDEMPMLNFSGSIIKTDGKLYMKDGTVYSPEGMFTVRVMTVS